MKKVKVDKNLFVYITRAAGFSLSDAAAAMGLSSGALLRRLRGDTEFRASEMSAWSVLVKCDNPGRVFFPGVENEQPES